MGAYHRNLTRAYHLKKKMTRGVDSGLFSDSVSDLNHLSIWNSETGTYRKPEAPKPAPEPGKMLTDLPEGLQ